MQVKQVYELVNTIQKTILGENALTVAEDLTNVVDIGNAVFTATDVDNYVKTLMDQIGKIIFVNRPYQGTATSVLMDAWEFGSVLEKVSMSELPKAEENESWELVDGASYDENVFKAAKVEAKFYNSKVTFEIPISFAERQVKESFQSASQLNSFFSMIQQAMETSMTVKLDALISRTINNMVGETVYNEYTGAAYTASSGVRAVNLLYLYNNGPNAGGTALTQAKALSSKEFIRFANMVISKDSDHLTKISELYNVNKKPRFTAKADQHMILLSDFAAASKSYLLSDTFHEQYVALEAETVPYWQGSGTSYAFSDTSKINIKTSANHTVNLDGIVGINFDRNALGVSNFNKRTTSKYNAKGEFYNNWYKMDAGYFNDLSENFIVYFIK